MPVCVKLSDDEEVRGVIEYYDQRFIRITRDGAPNLFIFKHDIKYLYEVASGEECHRCVLQSRFSSNRGQAADDR